ncbi:MAG TPA: hypothetical protein VIL23_00505 [Clostridia bacterium]
MRMGKKMRIATILMSIAMIATTLVFATFAITQNNFNTDYDGLLKIIGDADIDVEIKFIENNTNNVIFTIKADKKGIVEKQGNQVVKEITDVKDLNTYTIVTQPELNAGFSYKFEVTISNRGAANGGSAYAAAKVENVSFRGAAGFENFYEVTNPIIQDGTLKPGNSLTFVIELTNKPDIVLDNGEAQFGYTLTIVANKVTA